MYQLFDYLTEFDDFLWTYVGPPLVMGIGLLLTLKLRLGQVTRAPGLVMSALEKDAARTGRGVKPLQAFFTSIGGCIGIGNIVAICTAIQLGGPGALIWMWIAAFLGMSIKYAEVFLGMKYRVENPDGGYDGGPMFFLRKLPLGPWLGAAVAVFLALYGTEVYMFSVVADSMVENWSVPKWPVALVLAVMIVLAGRGGVERVGKLCSVIIPVFLVLYVAMVLVVLWGHRGDLLPTLGVAVGSAFTGHAAFGGFAGASMSMAMAQGVARGCYSGDIGVGYASVVHSESTLAEPAHQASLAVFGIFLDTFVVCTATTLLILSTGVWQQDISASQLVQVALAQHFPHMDVFMPIFIFLLGYSSMIAFFCVGLKCANFLSKRYGRAIYTIFGTGAFLVFAHVDQSQALTVMSIAGALLLIINIIGIAALRKEVSI